MSTATAQLPTVVKEPQPFPSTFWDKWIGKEIVIQTKGKALITGTFKEFRNTFLIIENATVTGVRHRAYPSEVAVDRAFISHFHEKTDVEEINGGNQWQRLRLK